VPQDRLVRGLDHDAVGLAVGGAELLPVRREVLLHLGHDVVGQRLEGALLGVLLHQARLRQDRHVRRVAGLDAGAEERVGVLTGGGVVDRGAGLLLDRVQDLPEVLLLRAGPLGRALDRGALQLPAALGRRVAVVAAAARGGRREDHSRRDGGADQTPPQSGVAGPGGAGGRPPSGDTANPHPSSSLGEPAASSAPQMDAPDSISKKCRRPVSTRIVTGSPTFTRVRGLNRATRSVRGPSGLPSTSVPASRASSRVSSVTTWGASIAKWTSTSEPIASTSSAVETRVDPSGASTSSASSMSSGRIPTATSLPNRDARAGRSLSTEAGSVSVVPPASRRGFSASPVSVPCSRFMAGEPMNPATNRLAGRS